MSEPGRMRVAVTVATVWTSPESARPLDLRALHNPADIRSWLASLSLEDKLDLCDANRVQTQALFGTEVIVLEVRGDWAHICIPEQATSKNALGYPGWVPFGQLAGLKEAPTAEWAEVTARRARLILASSELELSYLTRLPLLETTAAGVWVETPAGIGFLQHCDARVVHQSEAGAGEPHAGRRIVRQAERFLGLPYLWGGMSSFGYDCSGYAYQMHRSQGITIPRDASEQALQGRQIVRELLEPGDLIFFARDEGKGRIHHVAIYAGDGRMLHSPDSRGGVEAVKLDEYKLAHAHSVSVRYWD